MCADGGSTNGSHHQVCQYIYTHIHMDIDIHTNTYTYAYTYNTCTCRWWQQKREPSSNLSDSVLLTWPSISSTFAHSSLHEPNLSASPMYQTYVFFFEYISFHFEHVIPTRTHIQGRPCVKCIFPFPELVFVQCSLWSFI